MGSPPMKPTLSAVHDAYQGLYNALTNAYWAASTVQDKDRIHAVMDLVFDSLTGLNQTSIQANTPTFTSMQEELKTANAQIETLKSDIAKLVVSIKVATQVASAIDKAVALAAKYFAL
jgi:hypothetical protein